MSRNVRRSGVTRLVVGLVIGMTLAPVAASTDLVVRPTSTEDHTVTLDVTWRNGWRDASGGDGVWFVLRDAAAPHGAPLPVERVDVASRRARPEDARAVDAPALLFDGIACYVRTPFEGTGDTTLDVTVHLAEPVPERVAVWGLEMVEVAGGPFEVGDLDVEVRGIGAFFAQGRDGPAGAFTIDDEGAFDVGEAPGALSYADGGVPQYRGDGQGPVPASFPKGTRPFLLQKYELLQGQYAAFLTALPPAWRVARTFVPTGEHEAEAAWTLAEQDGRIVATAPSRPCMYVSWDDTCAFLDWMGLRPMTELEFEKAARGSRPVGSRDYPWGGEDASVVKRVVLPSRDLAHASAHEERALVARSREASGLAPCGAFDLSGSLWERVVSLGHPAGRAFRGSHGDGQLDPEIGAADVPDWPRSRDDPRAADGIGYRGGAEYFAEPGLTNPFSPVGGRTYAAWNGAFRSPTYSARGVRTLP